MAKVKLTAGRIASFHCGKDKGQEFLWCDSVPGLAIRSTKGSKQKKYIFQSKVSGKSIRVTIGDIKTWSIDGAQAEARRLQVLIDQGYDPRQVKAEREAARKESASANKSQQARESVTLGMAWNEYIEARKPQWSELHYRDHLRSMHAGGVIRKRSGKKTIPGTLAALGNILLVNLTTEKVEEWARMEVMQRPARARLSLRLLQAFFFCCTRHPSYKAFVTAYAAQSREAREILG